MNDMVLGHSLTFELQLTATSGPWKQSWPRPYCNGQ